jgi:hypothetical protein
MIFTKHPDFENIHDIEKYSSFENYSLFEKCSDLKSCSPGKKVQILKFHDLNNAQLGKLFTNF